MATYVANIMGVDVDARDTTPQFALGTTALGYNSSTGAPLKFAYVQADGAIAASHTDITVSAVSQASDGSGTWGNSAVAFADDEYGWVWDEVN
jgi:hypothetical protein